MGHSTKSIKWQEHSIISLRATGGLKEITCFGRKASSDTMVVPTDMGVAVEVLVLACIIIDSLTPALFAYRI